MKIKFWFLIAILVSVFAGILIGAKSRHFTKCPGNQVLIAGECFTPGQYYASGFPK